jgi:hypothetical protein
MGADCKSVGESLRRFESYICHRGPLWTKIIHRGFSVSVLGRTEGAEGHVPVGLSPLLWATTRNMALTTRFGVWTWECVISFTTSPR